MPTEREWGNLEKEVNSLRHDFRNYRMVVSSVSEDLAELKQDFQKVKTRIATAVAAVVVAAGIIAWAAEMLLRGN